ncbi:PQQ-dependent sugar dehydrogenase [uncultured Ramlibacter sp.]|uniref:PQQ-dependent sugar dehydrogenase n=1 Tax=uncultured Ramlibacter sp. TaxID=260755 RepID=UPI0026184347|nr:PQQ-dependent sugar dehydrogenase [uncultured Ramlibacter sp.]
MSTRERIARWCAASLALAAAVAVAQTPPAAPAGAPAQEEPFWARGRPRSDATAMRMAPVPSYPIPTAADKLPLAKFKLPPGFKIEPWATGLLDARALRQGDRGTVFVSTRFVGSKVYAVSDKGGSREVKTLIDKMQLPTGIETHNGALYVATPKQVLRYDNIEGKLDNVGQPVVVYDKLPGDVPHGWKYIRIRDNKLYVPVGAPCNICEPGDTHAQILRMNLDGSNVEVVAKGVRNTVGFDFDPKNGELWFTDNGRDWLSEDLPHDELNRVGAPGQHFGFPYCHQGDFTDPEFGWGKSCSAYQKPALLLGPHAAALGMTFYTGAMFPSNYQGAMFIARHGPWNRTAKYADILVAWPDGKGGIARSEPFLTGLVENNQYLGRPVDFLQLKDGSLLVSDDFHGAVYRISYSR